MIFGRATKRVPADASRIFYFGFQAVFLDFLTTMHNRLPTSVKKLPIEIIVLVSFQTFFHIIYLLSLIYFH